MTRDEFWAFLDEFGATSSMIPTGHRLVSRSRIDAQGVDRDEFKARTEAVGGHVHRKVIDRSREVIGGRGRRADTVQVHYIVPPRTVVQAG